MKLRYIVLAATLPLLAGCAQEIIVPEDNLVTFYAVGDDEDAATKTVMVNGSSIYWRAQEDIRIYYNGYSYKFTSTNTRPSASVEFKGSFGSSEWKEGNLALAVYPYSNCSTGSVNGARVTLPCYQEAIADSFGIDCNPSAARTKDNNLYFKNICGGVKFKVGDEGIRKVVFRGNNGEKIAGVFNFVYNGDNPVPSSLERGDTEVTLEATNSEGFLKGHWYYISLIPQNLQDGYTMDVYYDSGLKKTISSKKFVTIKRATWGVISALSSKLELSTRAVELYTMTGISTSATVRLTNSGSESITFSSIDCPSGITASISGGNTIQAGKSKDLVITFAPTTATWTRIKYAPLTLIGNGINEMIEINATAAASIHDNYDAVVAQLDADAIDVGFSIDGYASVDQADNGELILYFEDVTVGGSDQDDSILISLINEDDSSVPIRYYLFGNPSCMYNSYNSRTGVYSNVDRVERLYPNAEGEEVTIKFIPKQRGGYTGRYYYLIVYEKNGVEKGFCWPITFKGKGV